MKNLLFLFSMFALLFSGCEEIAPAIDFSVPIIPLKDSTSINTVVPAPQHKAVLIEDVTGVRCINCPDAAQKAKDIVAQKSEDSVVVMALYPTNILDNFTHPYPNVPQLASDIARQIVETLGVPSGLPNGFIDRNKFVGKTDRTINYSEWINYVNQRLRLTTPVNISLSKTLVNNNLKVQFKLEYNTNTPATTTATHKYGLYLIEDGIVSTQYDHTGQNLTYVHNHALRYAFGLAVGNPLTQSIIPGRTYVKEFEYNIPTDYVVANCRIVCMVLDTNTEEVINVREISLK